MRGGPLRAVPGGRFGEGGSGTVFGEGRSPAPRTRTAAPVLGAPRGGLSPFLGREVSPGRLGVLSAAPPARRPPGSRARGPRTSWAWG